MPAFLPLFSVEQVREIERAAIVDLQIPAFTLMSRAGAAAFATVRRCWPAARRLLVACGGGNNGGDGYVLARLAREAGLEVHVVVAEDRAPAAAEAARAASEWAAAGGTHSAFDGELPDAELIVDAVLGIGLKQPPREHVAALLRALATHGAPVLALDVPSGLDADRGCVPGAVLAADATISFVAAKRGLYTGAARRCTGDIELCALDLPSEVLQRAPAASLACSGALAHWLPQPRHANAHKGDHGHVLVVGGDLGMGGAVRLAAEAAARSGAGLVSVATRGEHVGAVLCARPELMVRAIDTVAQLDGMLARADVLAIGPGLGREAWGRAVFAHCLAAGKPLVLDADALNQLAEQGAVPVDAVLTPHPGEAARLLGCASADVQRDRFAAAAELARRYASVVVLKGAGTIVAAPNITPLVIGAGNPGMASAGMGDVLTGVIAALRAQGLDAFSAARTGALLHSAAGDRAAAAGGERGLLATDLLAELRRLLNPVEAAHG